MRYLSTRAQADGPTHSFSDILLEGLAADGGLYLPVSYPQITDEMLTDWRRVLADEGYAGLAHRVISLYIDDIPAPDLAELCQHAYSAENFGSTDVVGLTRIGDGQLWIGHISNGPTAAFKDMAMSLLGELFEYELRRRGRRLTILGATSGDTGSSAEYAMRGREGIEVFMLTPAGRMTPFQQAQMFGLSDPNIHNIALDGVFDDCQDVVKQVNADAEFKQKYSLGAVNSINWARLLAQVVYYVALYLRMTTDNAQRISFAVPSGNFGNICAGHIAREMGLPIDRLVLATNENDVLHEFFATGRYRVRGGSEVAATSSPSMDISKASNLERFVHDLMGRDARITTELFVERLSTKGRFSLRRTPQFEQLPQRYGFLSGNSTHADRVQTIRGLWRNCGILVDPHTADGVHVAHHWMDRIDTPIVVLETALPVKFAATMVEAVGIVPPVPERFVGIMDAPHRVVSLPNDAEAVKAYIVDQLS